ncbi:DEAD/DEAH box helicase [Aquibacillus koreensis]|uniref:DEAD/DEAH box helicase n=1 Tax=Aquibacillus koreensis TaxID=279446 RepID=A0A9X3WI48_9BACI|nr:DEAD/DEAH box helicase [Aquibacillus koreensis]MCT2537582.1 DEAD/DEAH box helicase [Aquibacillus koreensis]MDC3419028.1 DEAD/DEAH box helicase [Aquibacillus koreensis]
MSNHSFKEYTLQPIMQEVIDKLQFKEPTPIQQKVIPAALRGESIIGQSHTGSGKTHAFLLPLFNALNENDKQVQFVVTSPTRELATQIYDEVKKIITYAEKEDQWSAKLFIGGTDKKRTIEKLKEQPQIVIGTPGRILDLINEGALDIFSAKSFVIDEADLMFDLGLIKEVDQMLVKANPEIQVMVFSATIPERLQPFLKKYLQNPAYFNLQDQIAPEKMEHRLVPLRHRQVSEMVYRISQSIQPYLAIIFTNGKELANELAKELTEKGMDVGIIHGGLTPRERKRVLKDIQGLRYQYIVATDLAARGIDIKGVSHVINAQMPKEEEFYVHRVGRTARAGLEGTAINIYTDEDLSLVEKLEQRGLTFDSYDVVNGEWKESKAWNERAQRKKKSNELDQEAWRKVRKPKKVKPGYKKKMKYQQEKAKRKIVRSKNPKK